LYPINSIKMPIIATPITSPNGNAAASILQFWIICMYMHIII
jgi:hypothetical protein